MIIKNKLMRRIVMKKILAVVLVLVFVVTMCSVSAGAIHDDDSFYDDWEIVPQKAACGHYLYGGSSQVKNYNYTGYKNIDSSSQSYYTEHTSMTGKYGDNTLSCCYPADLAAKSKPSFFINDGNYHYLFKTTSGYMKVVNYVPQNYFLWFSYDNNFNVIGKGKVNLELPLFLCAYSNDNYYFILEGDQTSSRGDREDLNGEEIFRLCVYNKSWGKVNSISVHDCDGYDTYNDGFTFSLGGTSMTESNGFLFVHTTVSTYGAKYQAGSILTFDIEKMRYVNDWAVCESNSIIGGGHILGGKLYTDKNGNIIKMQHADAVYRGLIYNAVYYNPTSKGCINACSGQYSKKMWKIGDGDKNIFPWKGKSGQNNTGAMVGDTNGSDQRYFCSFASVTQDDSFSSNKDYNAYLSTMYFTNSGLYETGYYARTGQVVGDFKYNNQKLTNYTNSSGKFASNPHIIKFNDNKFAIMWAEMNCITGGFEQSGNIYYAFFDRYGNLTSSVKSVKGYISEVCPVVSDSKAVWYVERNGVNYFYTFTDTGVLTEKKNEEVTINYLYTPKNVKATNNINTVRVTWDKVANATKYKVLYKQPGENNFKIYDYSTTNYCDVNGLRNDIEYQFAVTASDNNDVNSTLIFNNVASGKKVEDVQYFWDNIKSNISQTSSSLQFNWTDFNSVNYNPNYSVVDSYLEVYSSRYGDKNLVTVDNIKNKTSYTLTDHLINGDTYYYILWIKVDNFHWYQFNSPKLKYTGKTTEKIEPTQPTEPPVKPTQPTEPTYATPYINSAKVENNTVELKWNLVSGISYYRLYVNTGNSWDFVDNVSSNMYKYYIRPGIVYHFTVRCVKDGAFVGDYDRVGKEVLVNTTTPLITYVARSGKSVKIMWTESENCKTYRVFKKVSDSWKTIANVSSNSYIYPATLGTDYIFTVRCLDSNGKYISSFDEKGVKYSHNLDTPKLKSVVTNSVSGAVTLNWGAVSNASYYQTFYKKAGGSWKKYNKVATTSTTIKGLANNQKYVFTVRCVSKDGKTWQSKYDTTGLSLKYYKIPALKSFKYYSPKTGMIKWDAVSGVSKYIVYYKKDNGGWKRYKVVSTNSCRIGTLYKGHKYTVTVKCSDKNGNAISYHNTKGLSLKW